MFWYQISTHNYWCITTFHCKVTSFPHFLRSPICKITPYKELSWNFNLFRIACVSCPTLYAKLVQLKPADCKTVLLEYDRKFEILYGNDFVYYDYTKPRELPEKISETYFDIVVADPPYLSEECLKKVSETVKFLTRGKILLCTGRFK